MDWSNGDYSITTDPARIDQVAVRRFLAASYWAPDRPADVIERSLDHSLVFTMLFDGRQVGLARVVTDYATFGWLCDVFIEPEHRGAGLGRWLVKTVTEHPELQGLRWILGTTHSHSLYARFGFEVIPEPDRFMIRRRTP